MNNHELKITNAYSWIRDVFFNEFTNDFFSLSRIHERKSQFPPSLKRHWGWGSFMVCTTFRFRAEICWMSPGNYEGSKPQNLLKYCWYNLKTNHFHNFYYDVSPHTHQHQHPHTHPHIPDWVLVEINLSDVQYCWTANVRCYVAVSAGPPREKTPPEDQPTDSSPKKECWFR